MLFLLGPPQASTERPRVVSEAYRGSPRVSGRFSGKCGAPWVGRGFRSASLGEAPTQERCALLPSCGSRWQKALRDRRFVEYLPLPRPTSKDSEEAPSATSTQISHSSVSWSAPQVQKDAQGTISLRTARCHPCFEALDSRYIANQHNGAKALRRAMAQPTNVVHGRLSTKLPSLSRRSSKSSCAKNNPSPSKSVDQNRSCTNWELRSRQSEGPCPSRIAKGSERA